MPPSDLHKQKRKTNFAIMLGILAFCLLIAAITYVKLSGA